MNLAAMTVATFGMLVAGTASAHHSFAMFDDSREVVLEGTLREFQWTNPHCFVQVMVPDAAGKLVEWSVEGSSPNLMKRGDPKSYALLKQLKPGDKVTVVAQPLRNGAPGGSLVSVALTGGPVLYGERFGPAPPPTGSKQDAK